MKIDASDGDKVWVAVPRHFGYWERNIDRLPFVAVAYNNAVGRWYSDRVDTTTQWKFYIYGTEVAWNNLTFEQKMKVRLEGAWEKQAKDYWNELGYIDDRYYVLEALSA